MRAAKLKEHMLALKERTFPVEVYKNVIQGDPLYMHPKCKIEIMNNTCKIITAGGQVYYVAYSQGNYSHELIDGNICCITTTNGEGIRFRLKIIIN